MGLCLTGNRLVLRSLELRDCAEMVRILADPAISYWVPILPFPYTASDAKGFFNLLQDNPHRQVWAITLKEEFIGLIEEYPNFGFWLDPAFWGQGLISEAADLVLKNTFMIRRPARSWQACECKTSVLCVYWQKMALRQMVRRWQAIQKPCANRFRCNRWR